MDHANNGNGNDAGHQDPNVDVLVIHFDRVNFTCSISGHQHSLDSAIAALDMAKREYERLLRLQQVGQIQNQLAEQARTKAIVDGVRGNIRRT